MLEHLNTQLGRELHILEHFDAIADTLYTLVSNWSTQKTQLRNSVIQEQS